jgi:sugar phosphate isomerase/epimerase
VPLGTGMVDLPQVAKVMKDINFQGPVEIQSEYPNGGANNAGTKLTLPRAMVLGAMKRDLLTLRAVLGPAGLI